MQLWHWFSTSGVNFTNILRSTFTLADPKSAKKTNDLTIFFALFESGHVKNARKMLVKSTPGKTKPTKQKNTNLSSIMYYKILSNDPIVGCNLVVENHWPYKFGLKTVEE